MKNIFMFVMAIIIIASIFLTKVNKEKRTIMTKKFFKAMTVAAFAIIAGYNVYLANAGNGNVVSDLLLANVEALSQGEDNEVAISCSQYCNDGIGKCWAKSSRNYCVLSGVPEDFCHTNMEGGRKCVKIDGTEYN